MLSTIKNAVNNVLVRAKIKATEDTKVIQSNQIEANVDEIINGVERIQEYGFTSHAPVGSEAVVMFRGSREGGLIIATDSREFRIKELTDGQVAIYDKSGTKIVLKADNTIEIDATTSITVNCPTINLNTDTVNLTGTMIAGGDVIASGISLVSHIHGGVVPGGGNTDVPVG